jgi:hypothetical protein
MTLDDYIAFREKELASFRIYWHNGQDEEGMDDYLPSLPLIDWDTHFATFCCVGSPDRYNGGSQ